MLERSPSLAYRIVGEVDRGFMAISAVTGMLFAILAVAVVIHPAPFFFDRPIAVDVQSVNAGVVQPFNAFVSAFEGFLGVGIGVAVIIITFVLRRPATLFVAFSALYVVIYTGVNTVIARPRPTGLAHTTPHLSGYSFPSGHVAFFVWLGVLAIVLLARGLPLILHIGCWILVAAVIVGAALSRIDVGAHWPSDVVGGLLVGAAWTSLSLALGRLTRPIFGTRTALHHRAPEQRVGGADAG
jgi:membrane-associated phospholipid phosphatase